MAIEWTQQSIALSDVKSIVVTEVARDDENDEYVREIRVFGDDSAPTPPIQSIDAPAEGPGRLLVTLRLKSADRARIAISVPSSEF